jgi:monovalent cation:H+ antiporter-2, CPA2 family
VEDSLRLIELGGVIFALALLSRVAQRVGLSPIPLYLLAGLAFGRGGFLPLVTSEQFIEVGASIGVVLLLLFLGLEYAPEELATTLRTSTPSGLLNAALNFTPGFVAGLLLGWGAVGAVVLGGVTYASSSGIASKLLDELRWTGNRETPIVLALLVMEDLTMALYLPVLAALVASGSPASTVVRSIITVVVAAVVLVLVLRQGPVLSRALSSLSNESFVLSLLGLTLLVSGLLELAAVSAAVGAFFVGLAVSGPAAERARPLLEPLRDLFAAVFFVFFSLEIDPAAIVPVLGPAIALALVTAGTKIAAVWIAARRAGIGPRGRWRGALVLLSRGEFSVAIAGIGVAAGLDPELGPVAAAYVLSLAVAGPTLARLMAHRLSRAATPPRRL